MRFAAIADIHGNIWALRAVLADIAELAITDVVNLGDHVSGPLEARRTADVLMDLDIVNIRGDQDRRLVEMHQMGRTSRRGDYNALESHHFAWMAEQPATVIYRDTAFLCHGSPRNDDDFWLDRVTPGGRVEPTPIDAIEAAAAEIDYPLILSAHTHIPRIVRMRDGRTVVNPGSVGCPGYEGQHPVPHTVEVGTPDACYAICDNCRGDWRITIRYVPYDSKAAAALAKRNGFETWGNALETGWIN